MSKLSKKEQRVRRHRHIRNKVSGTAEQPRLCVCRTGAHIYCQVIDDEAGVTLVVAQEILAGNTPDASTCDKFAADAAFDTETYNNGIGVVPSFLLVPYSIDKDNLQLLVDTGLYTMGADGYLAAA